VSANSLYIVRCFCFKKEPDDLLPKDMANSCQKSNRILCQAIRLPEKSDELNEEFNLKLAPEQQEIAKMLDRRTGFGILSNDFREWNASNLLYLGCEARVSRTDRKEH
jgi:hypothetical protein